jgi:hypothetical protein
MARLLRHSWFVSTLAGAGWKSGERCMAVTPDTRIEEIFETLKHVDKGELVTVVMSRWNDNPEHRNSVYPVRCIRFEKTW